MTASRDDVCRIARSWLGTPWQHRQQLRGAGVDCAQLLIAVYAEAGIVPADFEPQPYSIDQMLHVEDELFLSYCEQFGRRVDTPQPGDAVVWRFGRSFSHGGIVLEWPGQILHAYRPWGIVCITPADVARLQGRECLFYAFG